MVHVTVMMKKTIQCTVVGDGMVGKTCLAKTFTGESIDEKYVATIFDNYAGKMSVSGDQYTISVFDCAGEHEYEELRGFSYKDSEVFIVCFSVIDRESYDSVRAFWVPEIKNFMGRKVPIILVGLQADSRVDSSEEISKAEGHVLAKEIGAERYIECSAITKAGVQDVFTNTVMSALKYRKKKFNIKNFIFGK